MKASYDYLQNLYFKQRIASIFHDFIVVHIRSNSLQSPYYQSPRRFAQIIIDMIKIIPIFALY